MRAYDPACVEMRVWGNSLRRRCRASGNGPISLHGRATPPVSGILREPRTKNAWRTAFRGLNLMEGTSNGECRLREPSMGNRRQWLGILEPEVQCRAYFVPADFRLENAALENPYNDIIQHK